MYRYLPGGDLLHFCNTNGLPLKEAAISTIGVSLLRALIYLHQNNVVHADVKLENCLFANDQIDSLQLVDFGLSVTLNDSRQVPDGVRGTLNYMAPEILLATEGKPMIPQIYNRTDVWAAGVILFTLSMGFLPFNGTTE